MKTVLSFALLSVALATDLPPGPCNEEQICLPEGGACLGFEDECCDGLGCLGYNFYKSCQEIPACIPEWYGCTAGGIECCKGMERDGETVNLVCAETHSGLTECQEEDIDTRSVEIPFPEPTPAPVWINMNTTHVVGQKVEHHIGRLWGDPHVETFDDLDYDCMGNGEFIILKSTITRRQVQGRFVQLHNKKMTATEGVVVQDEGDTPKVQVTFPMVDEGFSHVVGTRGCKLQFFVNDKQIDPYNFVHSGVTIDIVNNKDIVIFYPLTEFQVKLVMSYWNGCHMDSYYHVPKVDSVIGMLGNADGDKTNDWMDQDNNPISFDVEKVKWNFFGNDGGYPYCTTHWCMTDPADSLFHYNQFGYSFVNFERCDLPANVWMTEDIIDDATPEIMEACENNLACVTDAVTGDFEAAVTAMRQREIDLSRSCGAVDMDCHKYDCCQGLVCVDDGELAQCKSAFPDDFCMTGNGDCSEHACCEGATCIDTPNGLKRCRVDMDCKTENFRCADDDACCDDLHCIGDFYTKTCKPIERNAGGRICLPQGTACYDNKPCCDGSVCLRDTDGSDRCVPDVCRLVEEDCNDDDNCCDSLTCQKWYQRTVCLPAPVCIGDYADCDGSIACCDEGHECLEVTSGPEIFKKKCMSPGVDARRKLKEAKEASA